MSRRRQTKLFLKKFANSLAHRARCYGYIYRGRSGQPSWFSKEGLLHTSMRNVKIKTAANNQGERKEW
jgi:hypothetical protein